MRNVINWMASRKILVTKWSLVPVRASQFKLLKLFLKGSLSFLHAVSRWKIIHSPFVSYSFFGNLKRKKLQNNDCMLGHWHCDTILSNCVEVFWVSSLTFKVSFLINFLLFASNKFLITWKCVDPHVGRDPPVVITVWYTATKISHY